MTTPTIPLTRSLGHSNFFSGWRALGAVVKREWMIFLRYPSWFISLFIWPIIFPLSYVFTAHALSGKDGIGMAQFQAATGVHDYTGYIAIGTIIWMWQNVVLWNIGFSLRNEQFRGTLKSNWLSPTWRFAYLLGSMHAALLSMLMFLLSRAWNMRVGLRRAISRQPVADIAGALLAAIPRCMDWVLHLPAWSSLLKEANAFVFLVRGMVMIFCGITYPLAASCRTGCDPSPTGCRRPTSSTPCDAALSNRRLQRNCRRSQSAGHSSASFWLAVGYLVFNWMERRARRTAARLDSISLVTLKGYLRSL